MAAIVTNEELLDWVGAGEESASLVSSLRLSALERLYRETGIDWAIKAEQAETASEAVRTMVYLSFHGLRDAAVKTDILERHLTGLIKQLQYGGDALGSAKG